MRVFVRQFKIPVAIWKALKEMLGPEIGGNTYLMDAVTCIFNSKGLTLGEKPSVYRRFVNTI